MTGARTLCLDPLEPETRPRIGQGEEPGAAQTPEDPSVRQSGFKAPKSRNRKPKIVHLLEGRPTAGAESLARLLVRQFADKYRFSCIYIGQPNAQLEEWRQGGLSVQRVERKPGLDWRCSRRLAALLQQEQADLVHAHRSVAFFYGLFARLHYSQPSILFTEHDRPHLDTPSPRRATINRMLLESRDQVVATSRSVRQALILYEGIPSDQVSVIYNGTAPPARQDAAAVQQIRQRLAIDSGAFLILQSAPFDLFQNHSLAIQAMEQVVRDLPTARLILVGDGPERETIQRMVTRSRLDPHVTLLGSRSDGDALLQAADLVLSTSIGEVDSSVLIQALNVGCPIVATRVGAVSEIVEDRVCGYLVNPGDYGALAELMGRLGSNPALREQFGRQGQRRAQSFFTEEETSNCYSNIYQAMLSH